MTHQVVATNVTKLAREVRLLRLAWVVGCRRHFDRSDSARVAVPGALGVQVPDPVSSRQAQDNAKDHCRDQPHIEPVPQHPELSLKFGELVAVKLP